MCNKTKMLEAGMNRVGSYQELCESLIRQEAEAYISSVATLGLEVQLQHGAPESEDSSSNAMTSCQRNSCSLSQVHSPAQDTHSSAKPTRPAPLFQIFWKAGNYDNNSFESVVPSTKNYLHVHPKFLHSNATSHKWAFGAVAELIDNTVDEIQNGATFVLVDKVSDPRFKCPALLIQGMNSKELGIDPKHWPAFLHILVSHRHGQDSNIIPMIDYEFMMSTATWKPLYRDGEENFYSNISIILQWSPYSTEAELLKQDIRLNNNIKKNSKMLATEKHIGNKYRYSLQAYLPILFLQLPKNFIVMLRGKVVEHHNIACDLKFPEFIVYRPHTMAIKETNFLQDDIITTIGFLKEAPDVNIHGFNVYHRNRLILPFWPVASYDKNRGRGVVGVLEEPIHNKQDFERTSLFQRLETRLKKMTWEY